MNFTQHPSPSTYPLALSQQPFIDKIKKSDSELNDPRMFCFHKLWNAHGECVKGDVKNLKCLSKARFKLISSSIRWAESAILSATI